MGEDYEPWRTFDVGYVHVLTAPRSEGGVCVSRCPHPDHAADDASSQAPQTPVHDDARVEDP